MSSAPVPFGSYLLVQTIKSGGAGEIHLAVDASSTGGRPCVVKRLPEALREEPEATTRFRREAHLARRLSHEGLVATHQVGEVNNEPYLAQEFVEGHDLGEILARCKEQARTIPSAASVFLVREVSKALAYIHEFEGLGLVHRNVNPPNVRVGYGGEVKLLDFGLSRSLGTDRVNRTAVAPDKLPYVAPEQLGEGPLDRRTDVYALGALLWRLLTSQPMGATTLDGHVVLPREDRQETIERILKVVPTPPSAFNPEMPPALDAIVLRALSKSPDDRFATVSELEQALTLLPLEDGRVPLARLMNRLFDASRERGSREELLAGGRKAATSVGTDKANPGSESMSGTGPASSGVINLLPVAPARVGTPEVRGGRLRAVSVTALISQHGLWFKKFAMVFVPALAVAIGFNVYETRRLQAEDAAEEVAQPVAPPVPPVTSPGAGGNTLPTAPAVPTAPAIPAASVAAPPVAAPVQAPPARSVESGRPKAPSPQVVSMPSAAAAAAVAAIPSEKPAVRKGSSSAPESGARSLAAARAAFERDEFERAIQLGHAALAAGETDAHALLGASFFKLGRYEEAEAQYAQALRLDPKNSTLSRRLELARAAARRSSGGVAP